MKNIFTREWVVNNRELQKATALLIGLGINSWSLTWARAFLFSSLVLLYTFFLYPACLFLAFVFNSLGVFTDLIDGLAARLSQHNHAHEELWDPLADWLLILANLPLLWKIFSRACKTNWPVWLVLSVVLATHAFNILLMLGRLTGKNIADFPVTQSGRLKMNIYYIVAMATPLAAMVSSFLTILLFYSTAANCLLDIYNLGVKIRWQKGKPPS